MVIEFFSIVRILFFCKNLISNCGCVMSSALDMLLNPLYYRS